MKECRKCGVVRPLDEFTKDGSKKDGLRSYCRPCWAEYSLDWYRRNKDTEAAKRKARYHAPGGRTGDLWKRYRITEEQYDALLADQGGVCAICVCVCSSGSRLAVDHDHRCCPGKRSCGECIRGLLCRACNRGLGYMRDDRSLLLAAVEYLDG